MAGHRNPKSSITLFGLKLATDWQALASLPQAEGDETDLVIERVEHIPPPQQEVSLFPANVGHAVYYGKSAEGDVLSFARTYVFSIGARTIACSISASGNEAEAAHLLAGPVIAYYLERAGLTVLHGSAVRFGSASAVFLGRSGAGKSTLAAAFVRAGHRLLTDDVVVLERRNGKVILRPGPPRLRLYPTSSVSPDDEAVRERTRGVRGKEVLTLHRHSPDSCPLPLDCIYLLRSDSSIRQPLVEERPAVQRVIDLVQYSYTPRLTAAAGLEGRRIDALSAIAATVSIKKLTVPWALERLPDVVEALVVER